jgi:hypothetical protein
MNNKKRTYIPLKRRNFFKVLPLKFQFGFFPARKRYGNLGSSENSQSIAFATSENG